MKTRNSTYNRRVNPALRFMAAFMLLFAFTFTACSGTLFKNLLKSLDRIAVSPGSISIANGTTTQLHAVAVFSDSTQNDITTNVTWSSSNTNIAIVDSTGIVTAIQKTPAGQPVIITATYKGLESTAAITITGALLVSLEVTPGVKSIANGTTYNFYAIGRFTDNTTQDLTTLAAWSGGGSVCSVGANTGIVTASATGTGTITAEVTVGTVTRSSTASVTVTAATLTAITTSVSTIEIIEGTTYQLRATGYYSDSTTQDITSQVTWGETSSGSTCTVAAGLVTGIDDGTADITATLSTFTATTAVTVTADNIESITITPDHPIAYGTNIQFTAIATLSSGKTQDITAQAVWLSYNTDVATIDTGTATAGLARSVSAGYADIRATLLGVYNTTRLYVRMATLQSLAINVDSADINIDGTRQFYVTGTYFDGTDYLTQDMTTQVSWTSSNTAIAEISNAPGTEGIAAGLTAGTVTITATRNGISDTATLNVLADSTPPAVMKAELLLGNRVRVIYDEDMDITEATDYANYKVVETVGGTCTDGEGDTFSASSQTGDFGFATGTPVVVESLRSFILQLNAGTQQKTYTLIVDDTATGIKDIAGNDVDCPTNRYSFPGLDTVKPYMVNVINTGQYITVRFSEAMKTGTGDTQSADYTGSYTLTLEPSGDPLLTIQSVAAIDAQTFQITLNAQVTSGVQYRIAVNSNVRDNSSQANAMGTPRYLSFIGNETLKVVSAEETVMGTVIITFNKAVDATSANAGDTTCETLYKIYPYAGNLLTATVGTGSFTNTVTLTYQADAGRFATSYTVIVANGLTGDNFDNASSVKICSAADPVNDYVQAEPRDRATFQGLGQVINNFEDGTFFEDPFVDGTSFAFAFAYGGRIYLGTNDINNAAFRFDPSGMNSVLITFGLATGYTGTCTLATGFGYGTGTTCGVDRGFNDERGVVGFQSVIVNPTGSKDYELLLVGPYKVGVNYGYFTQDVDTQLDWSPCAIGTTGGNNTQSIQTLYGHGAYVYYAISSKHGTQAPLVSCHTVSVSSDVISLSGGTDMQTRSVSYLGKNAGGTSNTASIVGIDSMIVHSGYLFMANNGGVAGSLNHGTTFNSSYYMATPSGFSGTTKHLPLEADGGLGKISPGQKGIPIMMEFNGVLYLVRNVGVVGTPTNALRGEVWKWDTRTPASGGNDTDDDNTPDPGEWEKIISGTETEIGSANCISMLTANGSGALYLGFDDQSGTGVRIFKYTGTEPGATSTTMSSAGWVQQGANGLGGSYQRILSSASISDGVYNYIYVTVVNGTNAIRVFRQID